MKKINSFILAAFTILSAASCQKEMMNPNDTEANGTPFSFEASRDIDTKTTLVKLEEGTTTYWTPGDKVSVFDKNGAEVEFKTAITENSASALFSCEMISLPEDLNIHAIYPNRGGVVTFKDGVITNLRVSGTQTAVAGSFDPLYAVAYAKGTITDFTTPPTLAFTNIHTLFKFTIGGEKAPAKVTLTNGGARCIVGRFDYNVETGDVTPWNDGKTATLVPAEGESFEIGQTYYIIIIGGGNLAKVSLKFDDTEVKYIEGPKYGDETNNKFLNRIINLGTVQFPVEDDNDQEIEPANFDASLVMAKQSEGATSYMTTFGGEAGKDRNIAIDANYLYIPETKATPQMWKISLESGEATSMPVGTVATDCTFALSCPRFIENSDASINEGNDVLVVSSMGMDGQETYLYFYKNGIDSDPHKVALHNGGNLNRRLGDKMSVYGTMQNWGAYFKEQGSSAIINWGGTFRVLDAADIWPAGRTYMDPTSDGEMGGIYFYSYETAGKKGVISTAANAKYGILDANTTYETKPVYVAQSWNKDPNLAGCHGFNFFKVGNRDYIAYTKFSNQTLYVINGASNADGVKDALEANEVVWSTKIAAEGNACTSGNSAADCSIHVIDDNTVLVAGHIQNVGVVVYKLTLNN